LQPCGEPNEPYLSIRPSVRTQQFDKRKLIFIKFNNAEFHGKMSSRFSFGSKSENIMHIQHAYFHTALSEILIKLEYFV
jgi:hypothetical protein